MLCTIKQKRNILAVLICDMIFSAAVGVLSWMNCSSVKSKVQSDVAAPQASCFEKLENVVKALTEVIEKAPTKETSLTLPHSRSD